MTGELSVFAMERGGVLKLYAVNGTSRTELASIRTGMLSDDDALNVGAALRDLCAVVDGLQVRPVDAVRDLGPMARPAPSGIRAALAEPASKPKHVPAGTTHQRRRAKVLALLAEHPEGIAGVEMARMLRDSVGMVKYTLNILRAESSVYATGNTSQRRWHLARDD